MNRLQLHTFQAQQKHRGITIVDDDEEEKVFDGKGNGVSDIIRELRKGFADQKQCFADLKKSFKDDIKDAMKEALKEEGLGQKLDQLISAFKELDKR